MISSSWFQLSHGTFHVRLMVVRKVTPTFGKDSIGSTATMVVLSFSDPLFFPLFGLSVVSLIGLVRSSTKSIMRMLALVAALPPVCAALIALTDSSDT